MSGFQCQTCDGDRAWLQKYFSRTWFCCATCRALSLIPQTSASGVATNLKTVQRALLLKAWILKKLS